MSLNWMASDYFSMLLHKDSRSHAALEMLVDDLHCDKDRTINKFLSHSGSEDFLWGLAKLLGNTNPRVAGNSAYIIGTLAESEFGSLRIIALTSAKHADSKQILPDLTNMLRFDDSESVMNAAGTMGTLAESHGGRKWMLQEACLGRMIEYITNLLGSDNIWTASNAALVLARLTIAEEGCEQILQHYMSDAILTRLITSLGVDEAGRGMNSAFAIGRMCDLEVGRTRLLTLSDSEKMISSLARMLCCSDPGASKNACFALSCLATNKEGHHRILRNSQSEEVLRVLSELLSSDDNETGWFAAMTLHTLASQPRGCLRLRDNPSVLPALKAIEAHIDINDDLKEEVSQTIEILRRLEKPANLNVQVNGSSQVELSWSPLTTKSGFPIKYQIFQNSVCVFTGKNMECTMRNLAPHTQYIYRLRGITDGDEGPLSDPVTVTTEETVPGPPSQLSILAFTTTQLKVGWEVPEEPNGTLRGYYVYCGEKMVEHTTELSVIISGLVPGTSYDIQVCAASSKGKGARESVTASTAEMGAHAPSKPEVTVRGRSEMNIQWRPPAVPLGRLFRYDVQVNGEVVYSGTDLHCVVRRLRADTEYMISVCAITSEGKCESKNVKKRTAKDEFEGERAPLYQTPVKAETEKKPERPKSSSKKRKTQTSQVPVHDTTIRKLSLTRVNTTAGTTTAGTTNQMKRKKHVRLPPIHLSYTHGAQKEKENTEVVHDSASRRTQSQPSEAPPEFTDVAQKKNTSELKKIHTMIAGKTKKSKPPPTDDDLSRSHDLEAPRPRPPKPRSGNRRTNTTRTTFHAESRPQRRHIVSPENIKNKPQELAVSSDSRPRYNGHRRASHPHDRSPDGSIKSAGSRRDSLQNKTLSTSMPEGFVDISIEELPKVRSGKHETDISWIAHSKKSEFQESIAQMCSSSPSKHSHTLKPGLLEFEGHSDQSYSANNTKSPYSAPNYVQRASTFISNHRRNLPELTIPSSKKQLDKIQSRFSNFNQFTPQWQPELSLPSTLSVRNHNKFVPMQFRTQPANLPGVISRQNTSVQPEHGVGLEVLSRSHTEMSFRQSDSSSRHSDSKRHTPVHPHDNHRQHGTPAIHSDSLRVQSPDGSTRYTTGKNKERNVGSESTKSTSSSDKLASPDHLSDNGRLQQIDTPSAESLLLGLGVSSHENNTLQSAR